MEHPEVDCTELLRGLDADELARTIIEYGLEGSPDPEIVALIARAQTGNNEFSARITTDQKPPKRSRYIYEQHLKCRRRRGPVPTPRTRPVEDLPPERMAVLAHLSNLEVDRGKPTRPTKGDWVHQGLKKLLASRADRTQFVPERPFANDPFVTREQAAANTGNPFTDVRPTRLTLLRFEEAAEVYDAIAFAQHAFNRPMNAHLTIRWSAIGVPEWTAQGVLDAFLDRAEKWVRKGEPRRHPGWALDVGVPNELLWVYVHEKSPRYGFHTHILLSLDMEQFKAFRDWIYRCLAQLLRRPRVPRPVAFLRRSYAQHEREQERMGWFWYRYVTKQVDPDEQVQSPFCDKIVSARDVLQPLKCRSALPVTVMQLVGVCRRLGPGSQKKAGFMSALRKGLHIYDDSGLRMPCLDNAPPSYWYVQPFPSAYPSLTLKAKPNGDACEVAEQSALQYFWLQAAWDELEDAERYVETHRGGPDEGAALSMCEQAQAAFDQLCFAINADRWDQMPLYARDEEAALPKPIYERSMSDWLQLLRGDRQSCGPIVTA